MMSAEAESLSRSAFEARCLYHVVRLLADGAPLREDMEGFGRHLHSLALERTADDAEIVAEMALDDGTPLTERYSIWTYDKPGPSTSAAEANQVAFMIAMGITDL
jgi:hypothetical protein